MGNSNKKEEQGVKNDNDIKINHQKFNHFVYHEPEDLIEITLEAESEKDINRWDQDLKRVNSFQDKETLLLPNKHQYKSKGFCGNVGSVKIFYENYPYLFEEEIENRIEMGKHFEEEELWYLLYSLCSSARDFSRIDSKIGDVRPYNIFINQEGQIKIANLYSWPYERTNFDKTAFQRQLTYLSPEEMRLISKGNHQNTTNKIISESFSIGLTLLQAGLLFNAKEVYSIEHFSVDLDNLTNKIAEWQNSHFVTESNHNQGYSPLLKNIVTGLCHPDDKERLRSLQVEEVLRPYQNEILNLKEFDHQYVTLPVKVQSFSQQPIQHQSVQSRPAQIELGFKEYKTNQFVPPQGTLVNVSQQKVFVANPLEPKLNSPPPPLPTTIVTETVRPVSGQTSVRFGQGQPANTEYMHGYFSKYAANQPEVSYRPQSIPVQSFEQQFTKYSTLSGNQTSGITIPAGTTTNTVTFSQGNNFNRPLPNTINTLNQPTGLPSYNLTFQPPVTTNYQSAINTTNTFKQFITTTSAYSKPVPTVESTKVTASIPVASSSDGSSDFLKKIDEQLQASRRQFPS